MRKNLFKVLVAILIVIVFIVLINWLHLRDYLSIEGFNHYRSEIMLYENDNPHIFIMGYIIIYVITIACCISGTIIFDLLAGYIFGIFEGSILVVFSYMAGSCINFLIVRFFLRQTLENKFNKFKHFITGHSTYSLLLNLTSLRLIAVIPFWIINIIAALVNVRLSTFILSTFIGILPSSIIYVIIGDGVNDSITGGGRLSAAIMLNPKIWIPLCIMGIILMAPSIIKSIKHHNKIH